MLAGTLHQGLLGWKRMPDLRRPLGSHLFRQEEQPRLDRSGAPGTSSGTRRRTRRTGGRWRWQASTREQDIRRGKPGWSTNAVSCRVTTGPLQRARRELAGAGGAVEVRTRPALRSGSPLAVAWSCDGRLAVRTAPFHCESGTGRTWMDAARRPGRASAPSPGPLQAGSPPAAKRAPSMYGSRRSRTRSAVGRKAFRTRFEKDGKRRGCSQWMGTGHARSPGTTDQGSRAPCR